MPYRWVTRNGDSNNQQPGSQATDYDIPKFGYKASFVMLLGILIIWTILPGLVKMLGLNFYWGMIIIGGLLSGFMVAFAQYFIQRKEGFSRSFWIVMALWSVFIGIFIFLFIVSGILM